MFLNRLIATTSFQVKLVKIFFFAGLLFHSVFLFAGDDPAMLSKRTKRKMARQGAKYINQGKLEEGALLFMQLADADTSNYKLNRDVGLLLALDMNDKSRALPYLEAALRHSPKDTLPDLLYASGQSYAYNRQFEKALPLFLQLKRYIDNGQVSGSGTVTAISSLNQLIDECRRAVAENADAAYSMNRLTSDVKLKNMGSNLNTTFPEYAPLFFQEDSVLLFTSRRPINKGGNIDEDGLYFEDMYVARLSFDSVSSVSPIDLSGSKQFNLKNSNRHESIVSLSADGNWLFTYKDNMLYRSKRNGNSWDAAERMPAYVNAGKYQNHIAASADGRLLIFASDMIGGKGGLDLYYTVQLNDSVWSAPLPIGDSINTSLNEESPLLTPGADTLYFASQGGKGWGGYDMYYTVRDSSGKWSLPINLGRPFNTTGDDIYLQFSADRRTGFIASGRSGGYGGLDIYRIEWYDRPYQGECSSFANRTYRVKLDASASEDPDGAKLVYEWALQDGETVLGYGLQIEHVFEHPGKYAIQLNAIDPVLKTVDIRDTSIVIEITNQNHISWVAPNKVYAGDTVVLDASNSYWKGYELKHCFWEVDGKFERADTSRFRFYASEAGTHIIRIQVVMTCDTCDPERFCYTDTLEILPSGSKKPELDMLATRMQNAQNYSQGLNGSSGTTASTTTSATTSQASSGTTSSGTTGSNSTGTTSSTTTPTANTSTGTSANTTSTNTTSTNTTTTNTTNTTTTTVGTAGTTVIVLHPVYFDFDESVLRSDAKQTLDSLVLVLKANPAMRIRLSGHTDVRGGNSYNQQLSYRRAKAVTSYLKAAGIPSNRITQVQAVGENKPAVNCPDENCSEQDHQLNRRVEISLVSPN